MYNIIKASQNDRRALFLNTAQKMGLHEAITEKNASRRRRYTKGLMPEHRHEPLRIVMNFSNHRLSVGKIVPFFVSTQLFTE